MIRRWLLLALVAAGVAACTRVVVLTPAADANGDVIPFPDAVPVADAIFGADAGPANDAGLFDATPAD